MNACRTFRLRSTLIFILKHLLHVHFRECLLRRYFRICNVVFFVHAIINKTVNLCCIILHYLECAICAHQTHVNGGSFITRNKNMNTTKIIFLKFQLFSSHLCALHLIIQKQKPLTNHESEQKMQGVEMICKRILMKKV